MLSSKLDTQGMVLLFNNQVFNHKSNLLELVLYILKHLASF